MAPITIAHEGRHALVVVLSGRRLEGIRLHSDTSGETVSRGRASGAGMVLAAAAGYLTPPLLEAGAAVFVVSAFASALVQALFSYAVAWFLLFGGLRPVVELARSRRRPVRQWRGGVSDGDQLARLTGVPGGVWVFLFAVVAVVAIVVGARLLVPATVHVPRIR